MRSTAFADRSLYLMPGEILMGGKQDRTLAQEVIVPPKTERMPISVFCVEHGRWSQRVQEEAARPGALPDRCVQLSSMRAMGSFERAS